MFLLEGGGGYIIKPKRGKKRKHEESFAGGPLLQYPEPHPAPSKTKTGTPNIDEETLM